MALSLEEFCKQMDKKIAEMGFKDSWEALAVAHNWREVFGTDLPDDYYHPRDYPVLEEAQVALRRYDDASNPSDN
jgi:hypothetical protein